MMKQLNDAALDQLFRAARTINVWQDKPVTDSQINALYDLAKMGPTSVNCCPARFYFVKSDAAKNRLKPYLSPGNVNKVMTAPVTAIIANDTAFADYLPKLFPHNPDVKSWFADPAVAEDTITRNATLQGAYLILAARSMGLGCGPMSGFDKAGVDKEFFAGTTLKSNFICSIGYGSDEGLHPRGPRLDFTEAAKIL
ncbi:malonic semialdehyde reductase [Kordiimonas pumila]|uniref:Putative NADH dehydrogenase/NAD(P)H nitroreductase ACFOKA_00165 n=1 Tax=Kordiimonas pumila TaxID=2161677 RepID=A0ABV7CZR2_9PROT|nr:malonic semialdehyde reductase [Kordiimonas pumila]